MQKALLFKEIPGILSSIQTPQNRSSTLYGNYHNIYNLHKNGHFYVICLSKHHASWQFKEIQNETNSKY